VTITTISPENEKAGIDSWHKGSYSQSVSGISFFWSALSILTDAT
jgi:hypothetical protein